MGFVDDLGFGSLDLSNGLDQTIFVLYIIVIVGAICGLLYFIYFTLQFKHKFRIREVTNGRKIVYDDKAREYKDKEGVLWWQLLKTRHKLAVPPPEVVDIDSKGKKVVEAYLTPEGGIIWAQDNCKLQEVPTEIINILDKVEREKQTEQWRKKNNIINAFQPYTTKQRLIYIDQHKKAQSKFQTKWQDYIIPVAGIGSLLVIVISLMVFWGDIAKPVLDSQSNQLAYAKIQNEQLQLIKEINQKIQIINNDKTINEGKPTQAPQ